MIRGLESLLASRKAFIDATASREVEGSGGAAGAPVRHAKPSEQALVDKDPSGFVGLFNAGATCYLNSFLQALYMLPSFRRAVFAFRLPAGANPDTSAVHQLQALFMRLACGANGATSTTRITASFGWVLQDLFEQQDVQELFQQLFEAIKSGVQGSAPSDPNSVLDSVLRGFFGVHESFVACSRCGGRTTRAESFLNLVLHLGGGGHDGASAPSTVRECLVALTTPETLSGANAYRCSTCGTKETATKGLRLKSLPRVLSVHLARFDMDWSTNRRVKNTTPITIERTIDLADLIVEPTPKTETNEDGATDSATSTRYELSAILVHAGAASAGHYFAYVRDPSSRRWLKCNDTRVEYVEAAELVRIFGEDEGAKSDVGVPPNLPTSDSMAPSTSGPAEEDEEDDEEAAARRREAARRSVPFVDPKNHAYILFYRRTDDDDDDESEAEAATTDASVHDEKHDLPAILRLATSAAALEPLALETLAHEVAPELAAENEAFESRAREAKAEAERITVEVRYDPNSLATGSAAEDSSSANALATDDMDAASASRLAVRTIVVDRGITLAELLTTVRNALELDALGVSVSDARLRLWDALRHAPGRVLTAPDGSETATTTAEEVDARKATLKMLKWPSRRQVLLEVRAPNTPFPRLRTARIENLRVCELDDAGRETTPRPLEADPDESLAELRARLASTLSPPTSDPKSVRIFITVRDLNGTATKPAAAGGEAAVELIGATSSLRRLGVSPGALLLAEALIDGSGCSLDAESPESRNVGRLREHLESRVFRETVRCNNPFLSSATPNTSNSTPTWSTHEFDVDSRANLGVLKSLVSRALGELPLDAFRLRSAHDGPELKDLTRSIASFGLNGLVYIELGRPRAPNEILVRILRRRPTRAIAAEDETNKMASMPDAVPVAPSAPPMAPPIAPPLIPVTPPVAPAAPPMAPPMAPPLAPPFPSTSSAPPVAPGLSSAVGASQSSVGGDPNDPFEVLGDLVLDAAASVDVAKTTILRAFPQAILATTTKTTTATIAHADEEINSSRIRLREKLSTRLTGVLRSGRTLSAACAPGTLRDGKVLVVQVCPPEESSTLIGDKHVLLSLARYRPELSRLEPPREVILRTDMRLQDLQRLISEHATSDASSVADADASPIPFASVGLEKPLPYQLSSSSSLASLAFNTDWLTADSTLANTRVFHARDGDLLVWADRRRVETVQYRPFDESDDIVVRGDSSARPLRIYSPEEQREMADAIRLIAELEAAERETQMKDAAATASDTNA